jgi:hypothetical protein
VFTIPNGSIIQVPIITPAINPSSGQGAYRRYPATSTPLRGRIILFTSFGDGLDQWVESPPTSTAQLAFTPFTTGAQADGWECMQILRPNSLVDGAGASEGFYDMQGDPALGARYAQTCVSFIDAAIDLAEQSWGALPLVLGGLSMGAWTTLQMVTKSKHTIAAYFANMPPTRLDGAGFPWPTTPAWPGIVTTGANLVPATYLNGVTAPGWVQFGSLDQYTQPEYTAQLTATAIAAGVPITAGFPYGRTFTDGVISGGTSFSSATCPVANAESGAVITGTGIPTNTTLTVTSAALPNAGPYTGTLSQTCTNGSVLSGSFPGLGPGIVQNHGMFASDGQAQSILTWLKGVVDPLYPQRY